MYGAFIMMQCSKQFSSTQLTNTQLISTQLSVQHYLHMLNYAFPRSIIDKIDQTEFDGFEYVNPLLMSAEDNV